MDATIDIWLPVHPAVFALFLGFVVAYLSYGAVKFVVSLWTGA